MDKVFWNKPCWLIYVLSWAVFLLQRQSWVAATQTFWLVKHKIFVLVPLHLTTLSQSQTFYIQMSAPPLLGSVLYVSYLTFVRLSLYIFKTGKHIACTSYGNYECLVHQKYSIKVTIIIYILPGCHCIWLKIK